MGNKIRISYANREAVKHLLESNSGYCRVYGLHKKHSRNKQDGYLVAAMSLRVQVTEEDYDKFVSLLQEVMTEFYSK